MPLPPRPRVGIVIPTADAAKERPARAIAAARETTRHLDAGLQVVESSGPGFRLARSVNRGFEQSKDADAWVLLNDDAFMDAGWLDAMIDAARAHPEVGVVGAVLRYPDGRIQHAGGRIPLDPLEFLRVAARHRAPVWALRTILRQRGKPWPYMWDHYSSVSRHHRLDFVTGACMLVTRAAYDKIGGIDDRYEFGAEDVDYVLRAREAGFEVALATKATGVHHEGATSAKMAERVARSQETFRRTWSADRIRTLTRGRVGVYHP